LAKAWKVTIKVAYYSFYAILKGEGWNNEDNNPQKRVHGFGCFGIP
jgi:hypothetical protein